MTATKSTRRCRTCGWTGTYVSAAKADYAKRQHSCEKNLAKVATAARAQTRKAAVDRTPRPCLHKEANHQHGTYACYVLDSCRCLRCSKANSNYETNRSRRNAYGRSNLVSAARSRAHVLHLMDQGMGLKRIVVVSDVSQGLLWKLIYGKTKADGTRTPSKRVRRDTEQRILAVTLDLAGGAKVPSHGTRRRLQALSAIGWSQRQLAERLGMGDGNYGHMLHHRGEVMKATADRVRALYDELAMRPPVAADRHQQAGITRTRRHAQEMGWLSPLAWDDDTIDDPYTEAAELMPVGADPDDDFDEAAVWRSVNGDRDVQLSPADKREVVRVLHDRGLTDTQVSELTGFKDAVTMRNRLGLEVNRSRIDWSEYGERRPRHDRHREEVA